MINYTNLDDAWGISDRKETFKNNKSNNIQLDNKKNQIIEKMSNKIELLNDEIKMLKNKNNIFEKMSNEVSLLKEEIQYLKKKKRKIEGFRNHNVKNTFKNVIEGFDFKIKPNKHLVVYITILFMVIISILLIHSFRKPIEFESSKKNLYIFPEDLSRLKELIDIAKNN